MQMVAHKGVRVQTVIKLYVDRLERMCPCGGVDNLS